MSRLDSAVSAHHRRRKRLAAGVAAGMVREWRRIDMANLDGSWPGVLARMLAILTAGQRQAAADADAYVGRVLRAQHVTPDPLGSVDPDAFAGVASDGRPLASLLYSPVADGKKALSDGMSARDVLVRESARVAMIAATQVADAGRIADQTAMAVDEQVRGYIRHVTLPACARCIILAGRFYRWSDGFDRHPGCDCIHIAARGDDWVDEQDPQDLFDEMRRNHPERLRKSVTAADLKALDHGADLNQVVNAHRGVKRVSAYGETLRATDEGLTKRGFAGQRLMREAGTKTQSTHQRLTERGVTTVRLRGARTPRMSPDQIFLDAERNGWDRDEVIRQLRRFGFVS